MGMDGENKNRKNGTLLIYNYNNNNNNNNNHVTVDLCQNIWRIESIGLLTTTTIIVRSVRPQPLYYRDVYNRIDWIVDNNNNNCMSV